jgi:hypothetical protein
VKRLLFVLAVLLVALAAFIVWKRREGAETKSAEAKGAEAKSGEAKGGEAKGGDEEEGARVSHDESGRAVIKMDDETQGKLGLLVAKPSAAEQSPELKCYGRVLDPAPLAALMAELASDEAAWTASSNTFVRQKNLITTGNTTQEKLQVAEAAALRDQLSVLAVKDRLTLAWGRGVAEQTNLLAFVQQLTAQTAVLIRLDLPVGESLAASPKGARISALSGKSAEGEFLGTTANVDPQTLGRGAVFLVNPNSVGLLSGEAVVGYVRLPGESISGVLIPSNAIVRPEGRPWIYVMDSGGDTFTRIEIPLEHPAEGGWLVTKGVTTNDYIVVTGAQSLHSEELKASLKAD